MFHDRKESEREGRRGREERCLNHHHPPREVGEMTRGCEQSLIELRLYSSHHFPLVGVKNGDGDMNGDNGNSGESCTEKGVFAEDL